MCVSNHVLLSELRRSLLHLSDHIAVFSEERAKQHDKLLRIFDPDAGAVGPGFVLPKVLKEAPVGLSQGESRTASSFQLNQAVRVTGKLQDVLGSSLARVVALQCGRDCDRVRIQTKDGQSCDVLPQYIVALANQPAPQAALAAPPQQPEVAAEGAKPEITAARRGSCGDVQKNEPAAEAKQVVPQVAADLSRRKSMGDEAMPQESHRSINDAPGRRRARSAEEATGLKKLGLHIGQAVQVVGRLKDVLGGRDARVTALMCGEGGDRILITNGRGVTHAVLRSQITPAESSACSSAEARMQAPPEESTLPEKAASLTAPGEGDCEEFEGLRVGQTVTVVGSLHDFLGIETAMVTALRCGVQCSRVGIVTNCGSTFEVSPKQVSAKPQAAVVSTPAPVEVNVGPRRRSMGDASLSKPEDADADLQGFRVGQTVRLIGRLHDVLGETYAKVTALRCGKLSDRIEIATKRGTAHVVLPFQLEPADDGASTENTPTPSSTREIGVGVPSSSSRAGGPGSSQAVSKKDDVFEGFRVNDRVRVVGRLKDVLGLQVATVMALRCGTAQDRIEISTTSLGSRVAHLVLPCQIISADKPEEASRAGDATASTQCSASSSPEVTPVNLDTFEGFRVGQPVKVIGRLSGVLGLTRATVTALRTGRFHDGLEISAGPGKTHSVRPNQIEALEAPAAKNGKVGATRRLSADKPAIKDDGSGLSDCSSGSGSESDSDYDSFIEALNVTNLTECFGFKRS
eukprot:TRINITY_DN30606_c0_g1_i1.p1 TRINITY_DN30606_c0_g1~~TRINITY_DN30606_c0_g1_i1.p1  ORF type:complete len:754 (-),score=149.86 TRINITY_DN30606_c0_g1_i1:109-2343(-)